MSCLEILIGNSASSRHLQDEISDAARSDAKVLLTGESLASAKAVAGLIHKQSRRRNVKLVALNCAAVPDSLLESELFGHVRGSFTGAYGISLACWNWRIAARSSSTKSAKQACACRL